MIWIDYILLVLAVLIVTIVLIQDSKDDINDAFSGESSELFKNEKTRGFDLILSRTTLVLTVLFVAGVLIAASSRIIDRF